VVDEVDVEVVDAVDAFEVVEVVDEALVLDDDPHPASTAAATASAASVGTKPLPANLRIILTTISSPVGPLAVARRTPHMCVPARTGQSGSGRKCEVHIRPRHISSDDPSPQVMTEGGTQDVSAPDQGSPSARGQYRRRLDVPVRPALHSDRE
jgi:hypothetical protein